jgi:hypothetical protein
LKLHTLVSLFWFVVWYLLVDLVNVLLHPVGITLPSLMLILLFLHQLFLQCVSHVILLLLPLVLCLLQGYLVHLLIKLNDLVPVVFFTHLHLSDWVDVSWVAEWPSGRHSCWISVEWLCTGAKISSRHQVSRNVQVLCFCHLKTAPVLKLLSFVFVLLGFGAIIGSVNALKILGWPEYRIFIHTSLECWITVLEFLSRFEFISSEINSVRHTMIWAFWF